jgi:UDPglucose--hexose-1-phosphate uridylyltransferase
MTERRYDPLSGEWRTFASRDRERDPQEATDEHCLLCPSRPGSVTDIPESSYQLAVLDSHATGSDTSELSLHGTELYQVQPDHTAAEIVLYSDRHDQSFPELGVERITRLVDVWADRYAALGTRDEVEYVFIFENKGRQVGGALTHPHGRIYGFQDIPPAPLAELNTALLHHATYGTCVTCDIVASERADTARVLGTNAHFMAYVPFAARFPYEVHITSNRHATSLLDLSDPERRALAEILHLVTVGYDALFDRPLPWVMSMHQAPVRGEQWLAVSHFHIELTPPYRSSDQLAHLSGPELGARAFLSDSTPEEAAVLLRDALARGAA